MPLPHASGPARCTAKSCPSSSSRSSSSAAKTASVFHLKLPWRHDGSCCMLPRYQQWLLHGLGLAEALSERAGAFNIAKAFLQGRADAAAALALLQKEEQQPAVCVMRCTW